MTQGDQVTLQFKNALGVCTCIKIWPRGTQPVMSNSSGMKDMLCNVAVSVMEKRPEVEAVALMSKPDPDPMMFLVRVKGKWEDTGGRPTGV